MDDDAVVIYTASVEEDDPWQLVFSTGVKLPPWLPSAAPLFPVQIR